MATLKGGYVHDPVHGTIVIPQWLKVIGDDPIIRRMIDIRQLGLKAYMDLPGAIHTRYLHSLGTMHLAKQLVGVLLIDDEIPDRIKNELKPNRDAIEWAAFIHDVGHGPYSHVMDYPLKSRTNKTHEKISLEVVDNYNDKLDERGISPSQVKKIIEGETEFPFVHEIVNGPLDVDKFDYMLRDSYHAGIRYGFDPTFLFNELTLVGKGNAENFHIGLKDTDDAIAYAEMFLLNWRTLYTVLYYAKRARIAELMLEKAILKGIDEDTSFKSELEDLDSYARLDEAGLRKRLEETGGFSRCIVKSIWKNKLYSNNLNGHELKWSFDAETFPANDEFLVKAKDEMNALSDELSIKLSDIVGEEYSILCDILQSRIPKPIYITTSNTEEGYERLEKRSFVTQAISLPTMSLSVYIKDDGILPGELNTHEKIKKEIDKLSEEWN